MTAVSRSVVASPVHGPSGTVSRGEARPGDILLAFQNGDSGGHAALGLTGGWALLDEHPGGAWPGSNSGTWAGVKVWIRECASDEPADYTATQGAVTAGVVTVMAIAAGVADSIVIVRSSGTTAPSASPPSGSGLEIRYAAGVPSPPGAEVSWTVPSGYVELSDAQSGVWTSAVLATRASVSSLPVEDVFLAPSQSVASAAFTVLIASAEVPVPEPPTYPPFTPGVGNSRYRFVFRRLLSREYLGDLDLKDVAFDARIGQAGSLSATIPIPRRDVGDLVAAIIPRTDTELSIGPGVISCEIYRSGQCWGEYWITGAQPRRSRRGTPAIALRGSTLEAYLAHVELQNDLFFSAQDQIDIARSLLNHLMLQPYANIGLALQPGTSGVARDRNYNADESTYGARLQELGEVENGFEWNIRMALVSGALQRTWAWGYPILGQQDPPLHTFVDSVGGGDILDWQEDIDALRGGTRWRARGASANTDASSSSRPLMSTVHEASAHLLAGWPRLDRTINKSTVTQQQTLEDWAAYWAATAPGALRVDSLTVALGETPTFTPASLGDTAKIWLENEWHTGSWRTRRIIGMQITPTSKDDGIEDAHLILEGREVQDL